MAAPWWRLWFGGGGAKAVGEKTSQKKSEDVYQHVTDDQPYNQYTEVKLLSGHTATVHTIARVDETRFVSASDDGAAIVWDVETGVRLHTLTGHTAEVTCVLPLLPCSDPGECCLLLTASLDWTMRLWDLNADDRFEEDICQKVIADLDGPIMCLVQLSHDMICSGGKDICLWDRNGRLLSKYDRSQLEESSHIHSVLKLDSRHFGIVAASEYKSLAVYDINKPLMMERDQYELQFVRYLGSSHKENICCLTTISANLFASGSRDGIILLWSTNTLTPMKMFHCAEPALTSSFSPQTDLGSTSEIRDILVISERYLFTAIGNGFKVYDVIAYEDSHGHPKPLASQTHAHLQPITCMEYLESSSVLVTASEDHTVRLWGSPSGWRARRDADVSMAGEGQPKTSIENFLGMELNPLRSKRRGILPLPVVPMLLGELLLHSDIVKVVRSLGENGLVTCGADTAVIIWKDGELEREKRDSEIRGYLERAAQSTY